MKIAIASDGTNVFQHFGRTPEFALFEIENGRVVKSSALSSGELGHGALAGLLKEANVELLICGGIGGGAVNALANIGVRVIGGAEGNVKKVAEDFAAGTLATNPDFACNHHHHEGEGCGHGHGEDHSCNCR